MPVKKRTRAHPQKQNHHNDKGYGSQEKKRVDLIHSTILKHQQKRLQAPWAKAMYKKYATTNTVYNLYKKKTQKYIAINGRSATKKYHGRSTLNSSPI